MSGINEEGVSQGAIRTRKCRERMKQEKKEVTKAADRIRKQASRDHETPQKHQKRNRSNSLNNKKRQKHESPHERQKRKSANRLRNKERHKHESPRKHQERKSAHSSHMKMWRMIQSPQQRKMRNTASSVRNNERHEHESPQERQKRISNIIRDNDVRRKRKSHSDDDGDDVNLKAAIDYAVKQGKKKLHRTMDPDDPNLHRAYVCIVCDCFVPSSEPLKTMTRDQLMVHQRRLGVYEYEEYHNVTLKPELIKQYHVTGFSNMLLSRRSRLLVHGRRKGWITCSHCRLSLRPHLQLKPNPPRNSIANGFVIGGFARRIKRRKPLGRVSYRDIDVEEIPDEIRALLAPVRPYGYIFAYSGGSHKSIQGHYQFFETDQSRLGGVLNHVRDMGVPKDMYIMLCGRMTPEQKRIVRERVILDTELYMDILEHFIVNSGHPAYSDMPLPEHFPQPLFFEDDGVDNNTDTAMNPEVERTFEGGTYYYSTAQDAAPGVCVYPDEKQFAIAMLNQSSPTLLAIGGNYARMKELRVEDVLPFAFPYGMGGPKVKRRTPISEEACLQRYMRLAMRQFMRGDVILVIGNMYGRIQTFRSGIMLCRSQANGVQLGETLSQFNISDIPTDGSTNASTDRLLNAINTTCRALGHSPEAAKFARKCYFAFMDHWGLNSLFLSVTPDDLCNFRIRLYVRPESYVSPAHIH